MSCATGSPRRSGVANPRIRWSRSIAIPFLPSSPRECAVTTNDWGVVNDDALADLGGAPLDGGSRPLDGSRDPGPAVELPPRADDAAGPGLGRRPESGRLHGVAAQLARAAPDRLAAASRG